MSKLSDLAAEMATQAGLGHTQFCLGVHQHERGELEYEWISWSEAFEMLAAERKVEKKDNTFEEMLNEYDKWSTMLRDRKEAGSRLYNAPANVEHQRKALIEYVQQLQSNPPGNSELIERIASLEEELAEERELLGKGWSEAGFWETRVDHYEKLISKLFGIKGVLHGPKYLDRLEQEVTKLQESVMTPEQAAFILALYLDRNPNFAGTIKTGWFSYVKRTTAEITGKLRNIAADYYAEYAKEK